MFFGCGNKSLRLGARHGRGGSDPDARGAELLFQVIHAIARVKVEELLMQS
ncbi:hypothetical protein ACWDWT_12475 [Streptomyces sp. NPDC003343]